MTIAKSSTEYKKYTIQAKVASTEASQERDRLPSAEYSVSYEDPIALADEEVDSINLGKIPDDQPVPVTTFVPSAGTNPAALFKKAKQKTRAHLLTVHSTLPEKHTLAAPTATSFWNCLPVCCRPQLNR